MDHRERAVSSDKKGFIFQHVDDHAAFYSPSSRRTITLPHTTYHTQVSNSDIKLWRMFSGASLGIVVVVEQTTKVADYLNIIAGHLNINMVTIF